MKISRAVEAEIIKRANKKGAQPVWEVLGPIDELPLADQATVLAALFANGVLELKHVSALEALAHVLKLANHTDGEPQGLGAAAAKLLASAKGKKQAMFAGYSFELDVLVAFAWARDRAALEGLVNKVSGGARLGLESVRFRFGESVDKALHAELAEGLARAIGREKTLVPDADGIDEADDDRLEALARKLVDETTWKGLLAEHLADGRPLTDWMIERLDAPAIGKAFAAMSEDTVKNLMLEAIEALIDHRDDAEAFTSALAVIAADAKLQNTVLAIVAGAKRARAALPIPRPWPTLRSYKDMVHEDVQRVLARGLATIFGAFDDARVKGFIDTRLSAGMKADALIALSVRPDKAVAKRVLDGDLDDMPEAHGALLAALGKPLPKEPYQLRLDTLVATDRKKRDARWLDALDLGAPLGDREIHAAIWAEAEILLAFPASARAEVVRRAVEEGKDKNHAIQLVRVLEPSDAIAILESELTSASPPSQNWLHYAFRRGSHPRSSPPWTLDAVLGKLSPAARDRW